MSGASKIEWTDATWNPVRGCTRVSPGCLNCYAERFAARFSRSIDEIPGPRVGQTSDAFHGFARQTKSGPRWTGKVELIPHLLDWPLRRKKPRRIFVNSMSDLFHESLSDAAIGAVFGVMAAARQHTFQVLTKRPRRALEWFQWAIGFPLPNVWLGVSVENQETADQRIPLLLQTPAAVRFVSYEPALGPIKFIVPFDGAHVHALVGARPGIPSLDWVIVGGESGPGARRFDLAWARSTVEQCKAAGVACFVKQLGALPLGVPGCLGCENEGFEGDRCERCGDVIQVVSSRRVLHLKDRKGGDPSEWPEDLRVQAFPRAEPVNTYRAYRQLQRRFPSIDL